MATTLPRRRLTLMAPIEEMSTKFALQKETCKNTVGAQSNTPPPSFRYLGTKIMRRYSRAAGHYIVQGVYFRKNARVTELSVREIANRTNFNIARQSTAVTLMNLAVLDQIQCDYTGKSIGSVTAHPIRKGVNSADYATLRGWIFAVRMAQLADGEAITAETNTWTFS